MFRSLFRRSAPPPAPPPRARVACLDIRPREALAMGIPEGAWVLDAESAVRLAHALPRDLRVLAGTDAEEQALAEALVAAGCPGARPSGGTTWAFREPAWKSPLPPGHPVSLGPDPGWIQDVRWEDVEFRFDVLVERAGGLVRVPGAREEDLVSRGPRGAAGLGRVV